MKKIIVFLIILPLLFTACDSKEKEVKKDYSAFVGIDENKNGVPDWQEKEIDLVYAFRFYGLEDDLNTMFLNVKKFSEKYPNIRVTRDQQFTGDYSDFDEIEMFTARSLEGTMPDIYYSPMSAECYDRELTLDLTPYIESDPDSKWISPNAREFMKTYDGEEIYGVPYQSVSRLAAINLKLLRENNIKIPSYDWTYDDYEKLRAEVAKLTPNNPIFPGIIDFSEIGPSYFDDIPNGWKGFNSDTQRFDFASAKRFGEWFEQTAKEGKEGLHFYDLTEEERVAKAGNLGWPWGDGLEAVGNIWLYALNWDVSALVKERGLEIDIYPMPKAPEGGDTSIQAYYDTFSLSSALEKDPVKAEAAFQLLKWLTYSEEGLKSRWAIMDEYTGLPADAPLRVEDKLMDFVLGWPVVTNPEILKNHPLVKGFPEGSEMAIYNFKAFKDEKFQKMLSDPIPYPRQIPAVAKAYANLNTWDIKNQIKDQGVRFTDIAGEWDELMNSYLDDYLREYIKK